VGSDDHFMVEPHTLKHMRELWQPAVMNRSPYGKWQTEGCREAEENAREKARWILENYKPDQLDDKLKAEIINIIEDHSQH